MLSKITVLYKSDLYYQMDEPAFVTAQLFSRDKIEKQDGSKLKVTIYLTITEVKRKCGNQLSAKENPQNRN